MHLIGSYTAWRCWLPATSTFSEAATVYGPQKGADPDMVSLLTDRLERFAATLLERTGRDVRGLPGLGAAGGLAGGLYALGATVTPGFDLVAETVGLDTALQDATHVVTGEGRLDATSFAGKPVGELLRRCQQRDIPVTVVCGITSLTDIDAFAAVHQLVDYAPSPMECIRDPFPYLQRIGEIIGIGYRTSS
jgi:glycerate kinase